MIGKTMIMIVTKDDACMLIAWEREEAPSDFRSVGVKRSKIEDSTLETAAACLGRGY